MNRRDEAPRIVDQPEPGWFRMRLVKGGPQIAARIGFDGILWWAEINGEVFPSNADHFEADSVHRIWTSGTRISESEYVYLLKMARWAEEFAPDSPLANPRKAIVLTAQKPLY